jgi:hypothetical protein
MIYAVHSQDTVNVTTYMYIQWRCDCRDYAVLFQTIKSKRSESIQKAFHIIMQYVW